MPPSPMLQHLSHALIRASAGTGKTHALVGRYAQWAAAGVEPQNIVAITFTRRAAAELRTRIRAALVAQGAGEATLSQLSAAPISNFHGLCLSLCEEFWPGGIGEGAVHVLGENGEDRQLFVEACESAWFAGAPHLTWALQRAAPHLRIDGALMAQLWSAISLARESAEPLSLSMWGVYDAPALKAQAHQHLCALRGRILAERELLSTPAALRVLAHLQQQPVPGLDTDTAAWQQAWTLMFAPVNRKGRMSQVVSPEDLAAKAQLLPSVAAEEQAGFLVPALHALTEAAWRAYVAAKAARGSLDFTDLIERTIAICEERPEVHRVVRERVHALLVDEAQDTNALQRKLVRLLAGFEGPAASDVPAATTVVGDWKQAIYTFRGADPQNFSRFADDLTRAGGTSDTLTVSYRSVPPLILGINALGKHLFGSAYEPLSAQPQPDAAAAPKIEGAQALMAPGMHWVCVQRPDNGRLTLADDAWATADHVSQLVRAGTPPQDIAVLMANVRGPAPAYLQAFAAAGVPLVASGTGDLLEQPHVAELLALCAWLADETRELDGGIALSAPMFGLSDDALYYIWGPDGRAHGRPSALRLGDVSAFADAPFTGRTHAALQRACLTVPELIRQAARLPMVALLQRMDALLHVRALFVSEPAARAQRLADFDALLVLADQAHRRGHGQVADCVSHLFWRKAQGFTTAQGEGAQDQQEAVLLSSVHASKGLQYPVVVLPALERGGQSFSGNLLFQKQLGMAFTLHVGRERLRPQRFTSAMNAVATERQEELRRLAYVAITRARSQVIFIGPPPKACRNSGFAGIVAPWAQDAGACLREHACTVPESQMREPPAAPPWRPHKGHDLAAKAALKALLGAPQARPVPPCTQLDISVSGLLDLVAPRSAAPLEKDLAHDGADDAAPDMAASEALTTFNPQEAGILAHALIARIDDLSAYPTARAFAHAQVRHLGYDPEHPHVRPVINHVLDALSAPLGQRLCKVDPTSRRFEMEILWQGEALGRPVQLRGQVDALAHLGGQTVLIDFKYSRPSAAKARYDKQIQLYAWALRQLFPEQPPGVGYILYLKSPRATSKVSIEPNDCAWVPQALECWVQQQSHMLSAPWPA